MVCSLGLLRDRFLKFREVLGNKVQEMIMICVKTRDDKEDRTNAIFIGVLSIL